MRVLILEPHASGHHGPYLQWMMRGLAERGFDVTGITLPKTLTHPSMQALTHATESNSGKSLRLIPGSAAALPQRKSGGAASLIARELAYWRLFRTWFKIYSDKIRPNVVFLPYLDYCLYAIGLLGSPFGKCPWVGLSMRPSFHYQDMGVIAPQPSLAMIKKALFFRMLNNQYLRRLLTIDEPLAEYFASNTKVAFFAEPAELRDLPDIADAKQQFGVLAQRKLILVYGAITPRKGVIELLQAVADPTFPPLVDVLLAGKVAPDLHKKLTKPWVATLINQGRLRLLDRFIESKEEPLLFAAADIIWLGYRGHYNASGVLAQAANTGRQILACKEGIIGWQTQRYGIGRTVNPENSAEIVSAVETLVSEQPDGSFHNRRADAWHSPSFSAAQDTLAHIIMNT